MSKEITDFSGMEFSKVVRIWTRVGKTLWVFDSTGQIRSHHPMDRCGGPMGIVDYAGGEGNKFYIAAVADCAFPVYDLVRGENFDDAMEQYIDWAAEHRGITIAEEDFQDYTDQDGELECQFTSEGIPVDTDSLAMFKTEVVSIELEAFDHKKVEVKDED